MAGGLIEREEEFAVLLDAVRAAARGEARFVLLEGEAGVSWHRTFPS